jgi:hypothetical protein
MKIAVPRETAEGETRVALTPQIAGQLVADGLEVLVQSGAGDASSNLDEAYRDAGATIVPDAPKLYSEADVVLRVGRPSDEEVEMLRDRTVLIGTLGALAKPELAQRLAKRGVTAILTGSVVSRPGDWAYELEVEEVFRGPQTDRVVIGHLAPATSPICSHQLDVGDRVIVALRDRTNLGLFSSAVWLLLPDGTIGTIAPEPPAATHDELFAYLRQLPDTSMGTDQGRGLLPGTLGVALVTAAIGLGVFRRSGMTRISRGG